jgi:hypothetical protein
MYQKIKVGLILFGLKHKLPLSRIEPYLRCLIAIKEFLSQL